MPRKIKVVLKSKVSHQVANEVRHSVVIPRKYLKHSFSKPKITPVKNPLKGGRR